MKLIEEIGQSEAYIMGTSSSEARLYHLIVDSEFMFSISNLLDAIIAFLLCLDILNSLLVFVKRFVFSLLELFHPVLLICFQNSNDFFLDKRRSKYKECYHYMGRVVTVT